jgi:hypothetical protein
VHQHHHLQPHHHHHHYYIPPFIDTQRKRLVKSERAGGGRIERWTRSRAWSQVEFTGQLTEASKEAIFSRQEIPPRVGTILLSQMQKVLLS